MASKTAELRELPDSELVSRIEAAKEWFRKADGQIRRMLKTDYPEFVSPFFKDRGEYYARLPEILDLQERAKSEKAEDLRAYLKVMQEVFEKHGPIDDGFLWLAGEPSTPLNALKQKLAEEAMP